MFINKVLVKKINCSQAHTGKLCGHQNDFDLDLTSMYSLTGYLLRVRHRSRHKGESNNKNSNKKSAVLVEFIFYQKEKNT